MSKEAIKNLLMDFIADYDPNKWSNDDVYEKYAEKIDNVRSMGEIIAFTELSKKVKDLEHRLSNCIEPKFKIGQEVYMLDLIKVKITGYKIINFDKPDTLYRIKDGELTLGNIPENELFATEEEAKAKLRSLEDDSL